MINKNGVLLNFIRWLETCQNSTIQLSNSSNSGEQFPTGSHKGDELWEFCDKRELSMKLPVGRE